jgi:hypothetical protein
MKNYYQFINEAVIRGYSDNSDICYKDTGREPFIFNIDMRSTSNDDSIKNDILNNIKKYVRLEITGNLEYNKFCYVWRIEINNFNKRLFVDVDPISTYSMDMKYDITPKEFLEVGLDDVKDYLTMKNDIKKYNI